MLLPKRVQRDLDAANARELAYQSERAEHIAPAIQNVQELVAPQADPPKIDTPPAEPTVVTPPVAPKDDFEHKYRVLQGMYEADVKTVKRAQAEMAARLDAVDERARAAPEEKPQADAKDIETFGADLIAMVQRYAEGQQASTDARLTALEKVVTGVTKRAELTAEQSFFRDFELAVPDGAQINEDPRWLAWLGEEDGVSGQPRQAALDKARSALDARRCALIFNKFKAALPAAPEAPSLADQVSPSGAGSPTPVPVPAKRFLSEKSITDFYNDVSKGVWRGREAAMNALEAEINLAVAENRVR